MEPTKKFVRNEFVHGQLYSTYWIASIEPSEIPTGFTAEDFVFHPTLIELPLVHIGDVTVMALKDVTSYSFDGKESKNKYMVHVRRDGVLVLSITMLSKAML
jgi:hypothetical protein